MIVLASPIMDFGLVRNYSPLLSGEEWGYDHLFRQMEYNLLVNEIKEKVFKAAS